MSIVCPKGVVTDGGRRNVNRYAVVSGHLAAGANDGDQVGLEFDIGGGAQQRRRAGVDPGFV